jgi:hypothetical protein
MPGKFDTPEQIEAAMGEQPMKTFSFDGKIKYRLVGFCVKAATLEDAKERARTGDYDEEDLSGADIADIEIDIETGKEQL